MVTLAVPMYARVSALPTATAALARPSPEPTTDAPISRFGLLPHAARSAYPITTGRTMLHPRASSPRGKDWARSSIEFGCLQPRLRHPHRGLPVELWEPAHWTVQLSARRDSPASRRARAQLGSDRPGPAPHALECALGGG